MAFVKNPILLPLQKLIGLAPKTVPLVLDEANVSLTLPMVPDITRRSRTFAPSTGLYMCQMQNEHAAAGSLSVTVNPFDPANSGDVWPAPVPDGFDAWLLGANVAIVDGDIVDLDDCSLEINSPEAARGWTITTGGGAIGGTLAFTQIAHWDAAQILDATRKKGIYRKIGLRWRQGDNIVFLSDSNLAGDFDIVCTMIWGLFPESLGQDGLV